MVIFLKAVHVIVGVLLVIVVLLQFGRGSEIGAVFGGTSTQTVFGSSATTVLEKITIVLAAIFMITAGALAYIATKRHSVFDKVPVKKEAPLDQLPGTFPEEPTPPAQK